MKKVKYFYNTHKLKFEKIETPLRVRLLQAFGFLAASIVTGLIIMSIVFRYVEKPNEKFLRKQNDDLKDNYALLQERTKQLELKMAELENRDNKVYRSIFEATPIHDSARLKDEEVKKETQLIQGMSEDELVKSMYTQLNNLSLRLNFQSKSLTEIDGMVKDKEKLLLAIPAIQPVSNKDLTRLASGFGLRVHPILKIARPHNGLDFTAPQGSPIYATADGTVSKAEYSSGFGNLVVINHGYGFESYYAHMVRIKARVGERVKRGDVIGYVGSTGLSSGPHCHYEVHRNGVPVDPVYYFYQDLTAAQFDRILKLAAVAGQSLD
ncbi:MAG: M23 family metallopeptidase [Chitinophagaceae bacterium]